MDEAIRRNHLKKAPRVELLPAGILILALFSAGTGQITGDIVSPASAEEDWAQINCTNPKSDANINSKSYLARRFALAAFRCALSYFFIAFRCFLSAFFNIFCWSFAAFRDRRIFSAVAAVSSA
jgi:hypothetical protein